MVCFSNCCKGEGDDEGEYDYGAFVPSQDYYCDYGTDNTATTDSIPNKHTTALAGGRYDYNGHQNNTNHTTDGFVAVPPRRNMMTTSSSAGRHDDNDSLSPMLAEENFHDVYTLGVKLGEGAFAVVYEASRRPHHDEGGDSSSGNNNNNNNYNFDKYAVKKVDRGKLNRKEEAALKDEISILSQMPHHDNVIRLVSTYCEADGYYYMVLEKLNGGELFDRIATKITYNEKEARDVCQKLFQAIRHCHQNQVAHRDLKPENLLLKSTTSDTDIKIADFGFAKRVDRPNSLSTRCGSPLYVAPEILNPNTQYDERSDNWSLGVIAYCLLGGYPPFADASDRLTFQKIRNAEYEFHPQYWTNISPDAKHLISSLLTLNPQNRLSAREALSHKWVVGRSTDYLKRQSLAVNLQQFKKFNARRKLKGGINALIASNRMSSLGLKLSDKSVVEE